MKVRKAVIPAAGLGTRFLPATKAVPKEMLPLIDTPSIQLVVEEAVRAGLTDILIVTARGKGAIEDHFDRSPELEALLEARGKFDELKDVRELSELAQIHTVRQHEALGLGHAVSVAEAHVSGEPFAVLLGDDLIHPSVPLLREMLGVHERYGRSVLAAQEVSREEISAYGAITPEMLEENLAKVRSVVEKPPADEAPSNLAAIGRYVFTPEIFDSLRETKPGHGGEIQLTDAINLLAQEQAVYALHVRAGPLRRREQARLPEGHRGARDRARRPRPRVQRLAGRLRPAQEAPVGDGARAAAVDRLPGMAEHPPGVHDHDSAEGLIPVDEARARVLDAIQPLAPLQLPLTEAHGCVSAEDVVATESLPAFASSAMDGFAVRASDVAEATPERPPS